MPGRIGFGVSLLDGRGHTLVASRADRRRAVVGFGDGERGDLLDADPTVSTSTLL